MRVAILETVKTSGGFEQEFDRLIIRELQKQGHEPVLYLPENSSLPVDFGIPIEYMHGGEIVDYEGAGHFKKIWLFIFLGVNPHEKPKFLEQARKCQAYANIKLKVTTLRDDFREDNVPNVELIKPPVLLPEGVQAAPALSYREPIRIGFFGHYRKGEKDVDGIIRAFLRCRMSDKAELVVQAAPTRAEDAEDMQRIQEKYKYEKSVRFIKGKVLGKDWYDLLKSVDVLFLPYSNPRYLYNWSAVYFNALALYKPVLVTPVVNPEVLADYEVGTEVNLKDLEQLSEQLHGFLQNYQSQLPVYERELRRANHDFSTGSFLQSLL